MAIGSNGVTGYVNTTSALASGVVALYGIGGLGVTATFAPPTPPPPPGSYIVTLSGLNIVTLTGDNLVTYGVI